MLAPEFVPPATVAQLDSGIAVKGMELNVNTRGD